MYNKLIFFVVMLLLSTSLNAQNVTINVTNTKVEDVLTSITKQTGLLPAYSRQLLNPDRLITIRVTNGPLKSVLDLIVTGTSLTYEVRGDNIYFSKKADSIASPSSTSQKITGVVLDNGSNPIIGASVLLKGTTVGTTTDAMGRFSIDATKGEVLQISFIGYGTQEVTVDTRTAYNVSISEDAMSLEEVVVVGYGVQRKKDLTGAISTVSGESVQQRNSTNLSTALQGTTSGVTVSRSGNLPGSAASIKIRGATTIGNSDPLYIIDGVPGDINQVNLDDVESISVLKDAASASIYGARAASGVVLVQTKRAKNGDLSINYNFKYGLEIPVSQPEFVDVTRYLEVSNELRYNDNPSAGWYQNFTEDQVNNWAKNSLTDPNKYPNTNWTDMVLRSSSPRQSHSLNIAGGTKSIQTKASFSYDAIDGLFKVNNRKWERAMMRINNDVKIADYLSASIDINYARSSSIGPASNPLSGNANIRRASPNYAAVWADGRPAEGKAGENPYATLLLGGNSQSWTDRFGGKIALDFTPVDGLKLSAIFSPNLNKTKIKNFRKKASYNRADDPNAFGGYYQNFSTTKLTEDRDDSYNYTTQFLANYIKDFGKHNINLLAGFEEFTSFNESLIASSDQYQLANYPYLSLGPSTYVTNGGGAKQTAYRSVLGRVMYNYDNKYLIQANIRSDASSRFHKNYRWGTFPSISAGWVITEENFMKNISPNWLSFAKLRASWGQLGNERIGEYPYQATIGFDEALLLTPKGVVGSYTTAAQIQYAIQNISWETTTSIDFGIDLGLFNNRLSLTADYYKKTTTDMLLALEIPSFLGFANPDKNTGEMYTNGYDIDIKWSDKKGDFRYSISANLSDYSSKMGYLGGTEVLGNTVKKEGSYFNEWYGYVSDGLFLNETDVKNSAKISTNVGVGDIKYRDISGPKGVPDGLISSEYDRILLGPSTPRYLFGGNIQLGYKGVDFALAFQGVGSKQTAFSSAMICPLIYEWSNVPKIWDGNYWSSKNTDEQNAKMKYPSVSSKNAKINYETFSNHWLFSGSYFRLKNITLGYTFPSEMLSKINIKRLRVFASVDDVFCVSRYPKGWDPEMGATDYPITTTVMFGISINF